MNIQEAEEAAEALLATVKHVMTGREIEACRMAKDGTLAEEERDRQEFLDQLEEEEREAASEDYGSSAAISLIESLSIQFSREIGDWINKRNAARGRKVVKADGGAL